MFAYCFLGVIFFLRFNTFVVVVFFFEFKEYSCVYLAYVTVLKKVYKTLQR